MISVEEFKTKIRAKELALLLDEVVLAEETVHVTAENVSKIGSLLGSKYAIPAESIYVRVVGSGYLGFCMLE